MKKNFISKLKNKAVKWSSGFDYLRLNYKESDLEKLNFFIEKIENLDLDNSNFSNFEL
jgi:hypothetical protein